ncbi:AAA family ATPase [Trichocoleus sp. FACHB-262]|uniref:ParA family protein n=1 Tax=Trichocoleus sp. FACHB-262 TaxID=2692869 RepID=UPI0016891683|nr:AAA family ATPase [Trichocoleus sp. FACHB-262]MBD2121051.1 ParA family protein [Trichocoleus sp. FACHB-262]
MAQKLAIFNMKGGVGKSATATNLAAGLVKFKKKKRVLLVDIDPQGTSGASLGIPIWKLETQLKDVLQSAPEETQTLLKAAIVSTPDGVDILPSNILLAVEEIAISGLPGRENLLKRALSAIEAQYDCILIDCPPNIGVFSINALKASDGVLVPVDMSYVGLLGIRGVEYAFDLVKNFLEHEIRIVGVLATRYDGRKNISRDVLKSLQDHFGDRMFKTIIPDTVKISEAPSFGSSIFEHDPNGAGAKAYRELMNEVLKRW